MKLRYKIDIKICQGHSIINCYPHKMKSDEKMS